MYSIQSNIYIFVSNKFNAPQGAPKIKIMKTKKELLETLETKMTPAQFAKIKTAAVKELADKYQSILADEIATALGNDNARTWSVEKLENAAALLADAQKEANAVKYSRKPKGRQLAVINAVKELEFPCDIQTYIKTVTINYAGQYFDLKGLQPNGIAALKTNALLGEIDVLNGLNLDDAIKDLIKNGGHAAKNAYNPTHARSSHTRPDIFPFILTVNDEKTKVYIEYREQK